LPDPAGAAAGGGCVARALPSLLVGASRRSRTSPRPHGGGAAAPERKEAMSRETYAPGPAAGARIEKDGDKWTLVLVRELRHPPEKVWRALTEPAHLREWAPFDADRSLGRVGNVQLTTVGAPKPLVSETQVKRADEPRLLEYNWGGQDIRWELEPMPGGGTRL